MTIDATFWVAISFLIFVGVLIYLKIPQKVNNSLTHQINEIKKELNEAEKLKIEAKTLLSDYENKIDKSKKETKEIINLAKKTNSRLHVFHLSTKLESKLFSRDIPLKNKKITSEVCIHHLSFNDNDYKTKKGFIKWNPSVKSKD